MSYDQNMRTELAIGALAVIGGAVAYKSGLARRGVKKFIRKASRTNNKGLAGVRAFKTWANNPDRNKGSLFSSEGGFKFSMNDFKRLKNVKGRKQLASEIKSSFINMWSDANIAETVSDAGNLEGTIAQQVSRLNGLGDTELKRSLNDIWSVMKRLDKDSSMTKANKNAVKNRMYEDLIRRNKLTEKQRKLDMKRKGNTSLTIGDLFSVESDKNGLKFLKYKATGENKKMTDDIVAIKEGLGKAFYTRSDGKSASILSHKDILNLKVDNSLMTDGKHISDLRYFKNTARFMAETLTSDFKIPVIGINPFAIAGVDKIGRRRPQFALLEKRTRQSGITGSTDYTTEHMFFSKGDVYKLNGQSSELTLVKRNMVVEKIAKDAMVVDRNIDAVRKMEGTKRIEYEETTKEDGFISNLYSDLGKTLDIGFDDIDAHTLDSLGANEWLNPNAWISKIVGKFKETGFLRPNKGQKTIDKIDGVARTEKNYTEMFYDVADGAEAEDIFIAMNKTYSIADMFTDAKKSDYNSDTITDSLFKYVGQFNAGRGNLDKVTEKTSFIHFMFDRVSSTLSMGGVGLSVDSLGSPLAVLKNLGLKRALPIYVAYNAMQFGIMLTEHDEDELGNKDHVLKMAARTVAKTDLVLRKGLEMMGIPDFLDGMKTALPGIDHITELPGISMLKLDMDYEERLDYYNNGYDVVRKNRFWDGGNQAFTGSKIESYRPNLYRRIMADAEFSDTKWGSRMEYFRNAPFPTPVTPLAPLRYFLTDPYHYDKKHQDDRPYPVTTPMFGNVPFIGGLLSTTVGEILKPTKFMHPHIVNDKGIEEDYMANLSMGGSNSIMFDAGLDGGGFIDGGGWGESEGGLSSMPMLNISSGGGISLTGSFKGEMDDLYNASREDEPMSNHSTSQVLTSYGSGSYVVNTNKDLSGSQNDVKYNAGQLYQDANNFFGLYGFMGSTVTGDPLDDMKVLENGSYAYSGSRMFWDNSVGGLGGDTNEIARRFLRQRMDDENLINPIKNTMPEWLPGGDYHQDFKTGDPYVKIASGELRLPGQAYERLHDIKEEDLFMVNAENLISVDDVINGTLNKQSVGTGQSAVRDVLAQFRDSGYILDGASEIIDHDRHVSVKYDGLMELGGRQGQLFVEAVDDLGKITSEQRKRDITKANFAMYATGGDTAFVQYVDAHTGELSDMDILDYDEGVVNSSMDNMVKGRDKVKDKIDKGILSNGDLYSPLDKLRILADTAPYSDEFRSMRSYVSSLDLSEEDREEISGIEERVSAVKNPLRTYDYKYMNRSTTTDHKVIAAMLSKDSFMVYGDDRVYKLAGISLVAQEDATLAADQNRILDKYLYVGSTIKVEFDSNPALRFKGGSNRVIVHSGGSTLQKELLGRGLANPNTSDDPIDMKVKTNIAQRMIGTIWEGIAHMDTPFHSKFLRVRSAKEDYERSRVFGKQFSDWRSPFSDYLRPLVFDRNVGRGTIGGLVMGTTVGAMFGKTKFGTIVGAGLGFLSVATGKLFTKVHEEVNDEKWRPKRVRDEQALYDYMDKMKYLKYRKLYHEYADKAKKEGVDVRGMVGASFNMKSKKRVKSGWMNDYKASASKWSAIGVPEFITRLLHPKSDMNISGILKDEIPSLFQNVKKKLKGTVTALNKELGRGGYKKDNSKARPNDKTFEDDMDALWSGQALEKESMARQREFLNTKMSKIRGNRLLTPLRSNLRGDRAAPPSEKLDKLMAAKVALSSSTKEGASDESLREQIRSAGVVPVYKGSLSSRHMDVNKTMIRLNNAINEMAEKAGYSLNATKAMQYYKMSEGTMHAYDQGDSLSEVTSAMPKKDRDYFREFVTAPDSEKLEILDLVPKYMRRPLEAAWGLEVEEKDDLGEYYKEHALPDQEWIGWDENIDLGAVNVKMAKNENLEFSDVNIWKNDVMKANATGEVSIPMLDYKSSGVNVKNKLQSLMGKLGYEDINYNSRYNGTSDDVNLYLKFNKRSEYAGQIEGMMGSNI